jgi:hydroxymethylbilane synthase
VSNTLKIATRKSPLALWQAEFVADTLRQLHPGLEVSLLPMSTKGDRVLDSPLAKIGGKGLFVKELENGLLNNEADIAVHSTKDVPVGFPEGLHLAVILQREKPSDAFVSNNYDSFEALPEGAKVGTSSLRRQCQIRAQRPDLQLIDLRGNVNTRLSKLDEGQYDAIILATSGLIRLGFESRIKMELPYEVCLPAIAQGALSIECREDDERVNRLLAPLHHGPSAACVLAERSMNAKLEGGCQVPIAGHAVIEHELLFMRALVGTVDGKTILRGDISGRPESARELGVVLAEDFISRGAKEILAQA